jgi:RNA polymerase sigma factor (sigma-70 family)
MLDADGAEDFAEFYAAELRRLLLFLYKQGASWDDAWDAAQDAFVEAMRRWSSIENRRAWIRTTARRSYVKQQNRISEDVVRAVQAGWIPRPSFADLVLNEEEKFVCETIAGLPHRQREVVAWYYDGYRIREIAAILCLSPRAVRSNLYQARQRLRMLLVKFLKEGAA